MNNSVIKVTIGMPVYNDKQFLAKALDSLLSQTYPNFKLIISDDGSTDGSEQICKNYAERDNRISYIRQAKNIGISKNMEFLLKKANSVYFMWAANDDLWDNTFIEKLVLKLDLNPKAIVAFAPYTFIDESDNVIDSNNVIIEDFQSQSPYVRLRKILNQMSDGFGYGLYRRKMIIDVKFPIWWAVNKNTPYNNIYPTLFYYLSKGEYEFWDENILWYNRMKRKERVNHKLPYPNHFLKGYLAFTLRKFNLAFISTKNIYRGSKSIGLTLKILPFVFFSLFFVRVFFNFRKKRNEFKVQGADIFI